jgi:hypothetical protein
MLGDDVKERQEERVPAAIRYLPMHWPTDLEQKAF